MSNARKQLETWLSTIEPKGAVVDIGGASWPVKGRTKNWDKVSTYKILDKKHTPKATADILIDINQPHIPPLLGNFDTAFALEILEYCWNPYQAILNMGSLLKEGGIIYCSTHFLYPFHGGGNDVIRLTREGIEILFGKAELKITDITPRRAIGSYESMLVEWQKKESKICYFPTEIGHLITAQKV